GFPVDREICLAELFGRPWARHVDAKDLSGGTVGTFLGDDFHHTVGFSDDEGPRVTAPTLLRDTDLIAGFAGCVFGQSDERDLGIAVDAPRDPVVIDRYRLVSQQLFDDVDRLGVTDVSESGCVDEIANGPDTVDSGSQLFVDFDEATLVDADTGAIEAERIGQRSSPDREDDRVDLDRIPTFEAQCETRIAGLDAADRHGGVHVDVPAFEGTQHGLHDVAVDTGQDLRKGFEHGDVGADISEHRRELTTDGTTADDGDTVGYLGHLEDFIGGEDGTTVDIETRDRPWDRTRREDDGIGGDLGRV